MIESMMPCMRARFLTALTIASEARRLDPGTAGEQVPGRRYTVRHRGHRHEVDSVRQGLSVVIGSKDWDHGVDKDVDSLHQGCVGVDATPEQVEIERSGLQAAHAADHRPEDHLHPLAGRPDSSTRKSIVILPMSVTTPSFDSLGRRPSEPRCSIRRSRAAAS